MKSIRRPLAVVLAFVLAASCLSGLTFAAGGDIAIPSPDTTQGKGYPLLQSERQQYAATATVRAIILMDGEPAAASQGKQAASTAKLAAQHNALRGALRTSKVPYTELFDYTNILNGMAIEVAYGELDNIAAMDGVASVFVANRYKIPAPVNVTGKLAAAKAAAVAPDQDCDGSGTVIAVLDSGVTQDHEAFAVYDGMLQSAAISRSAAETAIDRLGYGAYLSEKIPFAYDYADGDAEPTDDALNADGRGTHMCGIAVGYAEDAEGTVTFCGAAPDAQLLAMKIYGTESGTTSTDVYFAALEDAYQLEADIICLSVGTQNGFTYDSTLEDAVFGNIYQTLEDAGIILVAAAGDDFSQAQYANNFAGSTNLTPGYTDYGTISSPSTYSGNLSVASADDAEYPACALQADGEYLEYLDSSGEFLAKMGGTEYAFVHVNGGREREYEGVDANGKIVLINTRGIDHNLKLIFAKERGAVAVVIYNDAPDYAVEKLELTPEEYVIPAICISMADGKRLIAYLNRTPVGEESKMSFPLEQCMVRNPNAGRLANSSSWGCSPDLTIAPQLTGIGSIVYSAADNSTDGYRYMSGTAIAAADVAGKLAAVLEKLRVRYPALTKAELAEKTESMAQSTASIVIDDQYYRYSPRKQGCGMIDTAALLASPAYITEPICNIGDDEAKSGIYTISFTVKNDSDTPMQYKINPIVQYDWLVIRTIGETNHYYNDVSPYENEGYYTLTTNYSNDKVTVPANGTAEVIATITLGDWLKEELNAKYPNGAFIDGFIRLEAPGQPILHATFLSFYGDWTDAPIIDAHDWRDIAETEIHLATTIYKDNKTYAECGETYLMQEYADFEVDTDVSKVYLLGEHSPMDYTTYAGCNPFDTIQNYTEVRIAVSNSDSDEALADRLYAEPITLRNARRLIMVASDAETGEVYAVKDTEYVPKTYYDTDSGKWKATSGFTFDGTKTYGVAEPVNLPNNTKVSIDYYADLAYGGDALGAIAYADLATAGAAYKVWSYPCVVDTAKPVFNMDTLVYNKRAGNITLQVSDNQFLAQVKILDKDGNELDINNFTGYEAGESQETVLWTGSGHCTFTLQAGDYATNLATLMLVLESEHPWVLDPDASVASTCTATGVNAYVCADCNRTKTEVAEKAAHTPAADAAVAPTCTKTGLTAGSHCAVCEEVLVPQETVDALQHDMVTDFAVAPTCLATGLTEGSHCSRCDEATTTQTIVAALGHNYEGSITTEPTCTEPGVQTFTCTRCDDTYTEPIASKGHVVVIDKALVPTCTKAGLSEGCHCSRCGDTLIPQETVDALGHDMVTDAAVAPTCTATGLTEGSHCSRCDEKTTAQTVVAALGHLWDEGKMTTPPTTSKEGVTTFTCTRCGETRTEAIPALGEWENPFTDVQKGRWYFDAIEFVVRNQLFYGTSTTTFTPEGKMTRAMLVTVLWRLDGKPAPTQSNPFTDVPSGKWYTDAVIWAAENQIISSPGDGRFDPNGDVTREQIAVILYRYAAKKGYDTGKRAELSKFPDFGSTAAWAKDALSWANAEGLINGSDGLLLPKNNATRAQVATILMRYVNNVVSD